MTGDRHLMSSAAHAKGRAARPSCEVGSAEAPNCRFRRGTRSAVPDRRSIGSCTSACPRSPGRWDTVGAPDFGTTRAVGNARPGRCQRLTRRHSELPAVERCTRRGNIR